VGLAIALLTVSDTRTLADDRSGDALQQRLEAAGHRLLERSLVPDNRYRIRAELSRWIADAAVQVVISSGGTGLTGRDGTPEAVAPLLDKTIEGFGELFRVLSGWPMERSSSCCRVRLMRSKRPGTASSAPSSMPPPAPATWCSCCRG